MVHWGGKTRVLITDDSDEQIRFLTRVLTSEGYQCLSATNGDTAFEICAAGRADIVLLDLRMPGTDGLATCRRLKESAETNLIPVLIMTGTVDQQTHLEALQAGADDFLPKPLALPELRARVRSASRMKGYIDELDNAAASIVMLGAAIEARDPHTNGHCRRLAELSTALGRRLGLDGQDIRALEQGGFIHDLGKVAIPDTVLFKRGALTRGEFAQVKAHPVVGEKICAPLRTLERARPIVRSHHEMLDGSGYPDGLRGAEVPLLAQITAVVDVFDALTSDRPYRDALTPEHAIEHLQVEARSGKRDASLVAEFATIAAEAADGGEASGADADSTTEAGPIADWM